jgi:hypothetical protein
MWRQLLRDPEVVRAYLLTKLAVLLLAALVTWPLARLIGPRAWVGLGVFALLLATVAAAALAVARAPQGAEPPAAPTAAPGEERGADPEGPVTIPVEDSLDLHPFPPASIPALVEDYLEAVSQRGFSEVRLIHGRGIGVQRERVRSVLARHPRVSAFHDAPPERGGWGATVVFLKTEAASDQPSAVSSPTHPSPSQNWGRGGGAES